MPSAPPSARRPLTWKFSTWAFFQGALGCILSAIAAAQSTQPYAVRVNGSPIVSTRPATRVAGEWFVPLQAVTRALGADLTIDPTGKSLSVLRSDGVTTSYDNATGRILQGSVLAGEVASFRQIQLGVGPENLLFPLSGVVALLGVTAREDQDHSVLEIESAPASTAPGAADGPSFQVASLDHRYGFATSRGIWQQSINLTGEALAGSNRLTGNMDLSRVAGGAILGFRQGSLRIGMRSQRAITFGDQGTYIGLEALSNTVRGLSFEQGWGPYLASVFAGRAASTTSAGLGTAGLANFDTNLTGFGVRRRSTSAEFSLGGNLFRGTRRSGMTFGVGYVGKHARNEFRLQGLLGSFSGFSLRPVLISLDPLLVSQPATPLGIIVEVERETQRVEGGAYGFSLADTYTPFKNSRLLFTGLWERYSRNFLVVREESRFSAVSRKSLSASVRPIRYINFAGSVKDGKALLGDPDLERGYTYGVNVSAPGGVPLQLGYFRSLQISGGRQGSRFELNQYSFQIPRWRRFSAGATYSEVRFNGVLSRSANEMVSVDFGRFGRFGFHDQVQFGNSHNYGPDWSLQVGRRGAYIMVGVERQTATGQPAVIAPVAAFNLPLPRRQSLRFSYLSMRGSHILQFEIGGPIIRRREVVNVNNQTALIVQSALTGQVYRDVDLDEKFTSGVDRPIPDMKVTLDDDVSTTTDPGGFFRFDGLSPGPHRLRAEMATLPANFIFVNPDMIVAVLPYRANRVDYLAIPTGQIHGIVFLATLNETGTEVTRPYPDARVIATGDRDTFSEGDGDFILGDLPPGTYQLRLDSASVPSGFVSRPSIQTVQLKPGERASGVVLNVVRAVVMRQAPSIIPEARAQPGAPAAPLAREPAPPAVLPVRTESPIPVSFEVPLPLANARWGRQPEQKTKPRAAETTPANPRRVPAPPIAVLPITPSPLPPAKPSTATAVQLYTRGRALMQAGDFAEAVAVLTQSIAADRNYALAYNARGYALLRMLKFAQSVADFNAAIRLNPAYSNAYRTRAAAKKALGDVPGAKADIVKANAITELRRP